MDYTVIEDVRRITRDRWLEIRKSGIGGSDAGAVMGVSPYKTQYSVWADKQGLIPAAEDNEAMRQGRDLEDYVAKRFEEATGKKVRREYGMLRSKAHPCMMADIDRRVIGEKAGLECKTSKDIYLKRYRNGDFPDEYYTQCLHYMAVTGWDTWYLAVLVSGTCFLTFTLRREDVQDDLDALIKAEESFWTLYMEGGLTPPADGSMPTTCAIRDAYPLENGEGMEADAYTEDLMRQLVQARSRMRAIKDTVDLLENQIKDVMREHSVLTGAQCSVTWTNQIYTRINKKLLTTLYPDVDLNKVSKTIVKRVFMVKAGDDDAEDPDNG